MNYLPLFFSLGDKPVLVIGGGNIAARKIRLLQRAGARIHIVSRTLCGEIQSLVDQGSVRHLDTEFSAVQLEGVPLVVAATDDQALNARVSELAQAANIPVNVVDAPELCTVIFPSIVDRDPLVIAISSSGVSPVLARILRRKIESTTPAAYGALARFAQRFRDVVKSAISEENRRRLFWEDVLEGPIAEKVMAGREAEAAGMLQSRLAGLDTQGLGEVYLVGAGPGDPDLLTFKAARLLQSADVVLYDRLVSPGVLEMARRDADKIYVGKRRAEHAVPQPEINQLLLELARAGKRVIRLKGGDPFVFGRGGEEIELLAAHNIPFQVVPGISAANGAACYAGIPLTHRDHAQSVRFVTGHLKAGGVAHDWSQFQSTTETLVFYMGLVGLPEICEQLQRHGRASHTPVALIERGTTADQRVLTGTLATMPEIVERECPNAPTLLIIGDVVKLHASLAWFADQGKRP
ncbi:MAG: siroheme synthase CysG [Gammaproteobacteria bacterium]|nr:siroheme synthase CysG [Gammaproteobacteria bacterium]